jgi:hypothetical protein
MPASAAGIRRWRLDKRTSIRVSDGRIASYHVYFDQLGFMVQLGVVPGAPAEAHAR